MTNHESPAEEASRIALEEVFACIEARRSFRLEAGAGAGKTYSLVEALKYLTKRHERDFSRRGQKIACITFTNVAKNEIEARTDRRPIIYCNTNHAFCWLLIGGFQKQLKALVQQMPSWQEKLLEAGGIGDRGVEYSLGHRAVREHVLSLHHDDVIPLTISLMENQKFRKIMADRFPIILIDEYQDTDKAWVEALKLHFLGQPNSPLFGFFGDHWQKIYGNGCGELNGDAVTPIGKKANFRSVNAIVECLNRMRPELPQFVKDPAELGRVRIFHTNGWVGQRQGGQHWGGDLPSDVAHQALEATKAKMVADGWDLAPNQTKILMLTHRVLASEQGYSNLAQAFQYNDSYLKKENRLIAFLVDVLEPAADAYAGKRYGAMFEALGGTVPVLKRQADKAAWTASFDILMTLRDNGSVGDVVDHLMASQRPRFPDRVEELQHALAAFDVDGGVEMPRPFAELQKLRPVAYAEVKALRRYLDGHSPFETKHGVKGAEFENVLVVLGRGWAQYNFGEMLELAGGAAVPANKLAAFERNRNLFYVACSRPKRRLTLLFTQDISPGALAKLQQWFGVDSIEALAL
ncbi:MULTISPECIES: UvrD-helicase domain-containing protein [unclassified Mesorhizobium]|uniref:UvrD-helicase domain-containing protein n=1 Tax=unclassified Mesorhizobium TaxID=325217 RepID=UPI000FD42C3C|nr:MULTISPECIES: UvrD-helicase domain-containing protein [unclassified Mesorhizobium]RUU95596.1 ATP-dependent helicase [Mesorhizobium sp. M1A.F.Ca.IN.020.03.2.1]RWG87089.1 MAG: ATP-dependent helicase [Mesorhizobium sp.]RWK18273.1 MAG: ATP-dependent helicase [Mesorhizobium sp.]